MHSHNLPLLAVLWLPAALALLRRNHRIARAWRRLDALTRGALLLMAAAAAVHLALIPAHTADPVTAVLFGLDALGLTSVGLAGLADVRGWRAAAALLLLGAVGAYGFYVATGREVLDLTGIATKADELLAVELLVIAGLVRPERLRLARAAAALLGRRRVSAELGHPG
jgi:hypothetical protein